MISVSSSEWMPSSVSSVVERDLADVGVGMRLDLLDDVLRKLIHHAFPIQRFAPDAKRARRSDARPLAGIALGRWHETRFSIETERLRGNKPYLDKRRRPQLKHARHGCIDSRMSEAAGALLSQRVPARGGLAVAARRRPHAPASVSTRTARPRSACRAGGRPAGGRPDQHRRRPDRRRPAGLGSRGRRGRVGGRHHAGLRKGLPRRVRPCRTVGAACRSAPGGRLAWLPQETIVFDRCGLRAHARRRPRRGCRRAGRRSRRCSAAGAMGERVAHGAVPRPLARSRAAAASSMPRTLRIGADVAAPAWPRGRDRRRDGDGDGAPGRRDDAEAWLDARARDRRRRRRRQRLDASAGLASFLRGFSPMTAIALRKRLVPLLELLNGQAGLPKVWSL